MKNLNLIIATLMVANFAACSKTEFPTSTTSSTSSVTAPTTPSVKVEHANKAVAWSQYQDMNSGLQIAYTYYALSSEKVDYEKLALMVSPEKYRLEKDSFKKNDLLNALKPQIDAGISKAKLSEARYFHTVIGDARDLDGFDFNTKSFTIKSMPFGDAYRYFDDWSSSYHFTFSNGEKFKTIPIADEAVARKIESLRTTPNAALDLQIVVYFFANDVDVGKTTIKGEVMKVQIQDKKGAVYTEH
jgi:Domain of unknown function (DUF4852)